METDVDMEIRKTGFPHRLAKRLLAFRTVPTGSAAINNKNLRGGPNQMIKVGQLRVANSGDAHASLNRSL
jgi:hypothetical protein